MITSNSRYPFGGKVTTIQTPSLNSMISTAKDGIFKKQSVMFFDITLGMKKRALIAKLIYNNYDDVVSKAQRLAFHDIIVSSLDEFGMKGYSLRDALEFLFKDFETQGIGIGIFVDEI